MSKALLLIFLPPLAQVASLGVSFPSFILFRLTGDGQEALFLPPHTSAPAISLPDVHISLPAPRLSGAVMQPSGFWRVLMFEQG